MTNRQIASVLTLAYWIIAATVATLTPRGDWIDLRWPIAIYFFAIPTTILLWMIVVGVHFLKAALSRSRLTLIGVALPLTYVALAVGGGHWLMERQAQRLEDQLRVANLATFEDEPLLAAKGPIGVRLRYRVVYPLGLDLDEGHGAFAQLLMVPSRSAFVMIRRVVSPRVPGHYRPGTYEFAEDFVPAFLPPSLLFAPTEPAAADHCFHWSPNMGRREILAENAQPRAVAIYLSHRAIQRSTIHPYRLADFYATAAQEGAAECAN